MQPLMYVLLYHIWTIITGYPFIMEMSLHLGHPYLESINIRNPTDQNARNFLVKFLVNFQRKRVEISITCECNLKIVKICQKCANFWEWLKIVQFAKTLPSRICLGLDLNLAETLFFFRLSFTLSVSNIHNPDSTPRLPAPPYLTRTRTSRETQSLVRLDPRRFTSKAISKTTYLTKFYVGSHCRRNEPITHVYTIFD